MSVRTTERETQKVEALSANAFAAAHHRSPRRPLNLIQGKERGEIIRKILQTQPELSHFSKN